MIKWMRKEDIRNCVRWKAEPSTVVRLSVSLVLLRFRSKSKVILVSLEKKAMLLNLSGQCEATVAAHTHALVICLYILQLRFWSSLPAEVSLWKSLSHCLCRRCEDCVWFCWHKFLRNKWVVFFFFVSGVEVGEADGTVLNYLLIIHTVQNVRCLEKENSRS